MARTPSIGRTAVRRESKAAAPARAVRKPGAARPARASEASPYHHGDLHDALLKAAETVLERDGLAGLTLRAVAREAGVSHAAPTHHFGDLTGLVSELAAIGFRQFNAAMAAAGAIDAPPLFKAMARAKAYVAYAQARPGMYGLMFRTERLDMKRPSLHEAAKASFAGLAGAVALSRGEQISDESLSLEQAAAPKIRHSEAATPSRGVRRIAGAAFGRGVAGTREAYGAGTTQTRRLTPVSAR